MAKYVHQAMCFFEQLNTKEWVLILMGLVVVGFICMRGFGSRSDY